MKLTKLIKYVVIIGIGLVALLVPSVRNFALGIIVGALGAVAYLSYTGSVINWDKK